MQICGQIFMYAIATGRAGEIRSRPAVLLQNSGRQASLLLKEDELPTYLDKLDSYDGQPLTKLGLRLLLLTFVRTTVAPSSRMGAKLIGRKSSGESRPNG